MEESKSVMACDSEEQQKNKTIMGGAMPKCNISGSGDMWSGLSTTTTHKQQKVGAGWLVSEGNLFTRAGAQ